MRSLSLLGLFATGPIFLLIPEDSQSSEDDTSRLLMEELQYSISSLFKDLEQRPMGPIEQDAMVLHSPHPSVQKVEAFRKLKLSLQKKLSANTLKAERTRQEIRNLWMQLKTDTKFCTAFEKFTFGCKPSTLQRLQNELKLRQDEMHKRVKDMEVSFELQSKIESLCDTCVDSYDAVIEIVEKEVKGGQELNNNFTEDNLEQSKPCNSKKIIRNEELFIKMRGLQIEKEARLAKFYCYKEQSEILSDLLLELMGVYDHGKIPEGIPKIIANMEKMYLNRREQVQLLQSSSPIEKTQLIDEATNYNNGSCQTVMIRSQPDVFNSTLRNPLNQCSTVIPFLSNDNENEEVDATIRIESQEISNGVACVNTRTQLLNPNSQACCLVIKL